MYITDPTWANHQTIFEKCGFKVDKLRYFDDKTRGLALSALLHDIQQAADGSILVLHTCCHNPTGGVQGPVRLLGDSRVVCSGVDPSPEEWAQLEQVIARKKHTVVFDTAYQVSRSPARRGDVSRTSKGYGSGDLLKVPQEGGFASLFER